MFKEDTRTDLGVIKIHKSAIASIASIAAKELEGVKGISRTLFNKFADLFIHKDSAIKVEVDRNSEVYLEVPLVMKYGFNIPDVCAKAQDNIKAALEKTTNLSIKEVNIKIRGIEKG